MADSANLLRFPHLVRIGEDNGREALLVDGVVQSISPKDGAVRGGYWAAMLPTNKPRTALILGLGGGTLAQLLIQRWGSDTRIVGVDDDTAILETARSMGWLDGPGLEVVQQDAFAFVQECEQRFDFVAVDLYRGESLEGRILTKPFLRRIKQLLEPSGEAAFNLFLDRRAEKRIERLARVLHVERRTVVFSNVIVHARP